MRTVREHRRIRFGLIRPLSVFPNGRVMGLESWVLGRKPICVAHTRSHHLWFASHSTTENPGPLEDETQDPRRKTHDLIAEVHGNWSDSQAPRTELAESETRTWNEK